ncbi:MULTISPECIES: hypothetical protein [Burkholderia]|uniref:hypothetical protein n=1 Tax=Burkholderia TaxID=32008 RepID=UPI000530D73F|nr:MULTISPECIES: hypothetical protein [Burkholderia]KGR98202.1 hypothetical protein X946_4416 [Burkholderia sp. ABCPW 111]
MRHEQDAYLDARLVDAPDARVRARVPGYRCAPAGERIAIAVDDDVIAYPR